MLREAFGERAGVEVDTQGDAFFFAFARASDAVAAAAAAQEALTELPFRVRMGVHTGEPVVTEEGYVGLDVHRAARIAAAGHGGQVLVSQATNDLAGLPLRDLGEHRLKDLSAAERIFQLGDDEFPPLKTLYATNLPVPTTPFVGRERELAEVAGLLGRSRLVTITGTGGGGKTRLGLQAAAAAADDYSRRCLVGGSRRGRGAVGGPAGDRTRAWPGRPPGRRDRRSRHAGAARQLRARDGSRGRRRAAARGLPEPDAARDEPRAAARGCRTGLPGAPPRAGRRGRALHRARPRF